MPAWIISRALPGLLIAAILAAVVWKIDDNGYDRAKAKYEPQIASTKAKYEGQIASDKLDHLNALRKAELAAKERFDAQSRNALRQSELLIAAKATIDALTNKLKERAKDVSTLYRQQPSDALQPIPGWIVTNGWLCDYNRAIGYGLSGPGANSGGAENPACAADPFSPSGVSAERIISHHAEYGGYCRKLEEQIDGLNAHIEFIEGKPNK